MQNISWMKTTLNLLIPVLALLLASCNTLQSPGARPFRLANLAKSDMDMVADAHIQALDRLAWQLLVKLYRRNPNELNKAPAGTTLATRRQQLFSLPRTVRFRELGDAHSISAVRLAFNPQFTGDRVFALLAGITGMIHASYNYQGEFFMLDTLDQQKIYNCARNLESVAWLLATRRDRSGHPLLLSNSLTNEPTNLSFERLFGKLISLQDMMARLIADQNNRAINKVVHGVASTTFLPI